MRIFGICLIKNEADIIEYCLKEALKWADKIFVYDNGSTDGTWEIVQRIAALSNKVVAWKSEYKPYHDGLRAEVYNEFKHLAKKGDWWAFIDADEFFIDDPRAFLSTIPGIYHIVKTESFEYCITYEDVQEFSYSNRFPEDINKVKYYKPRSYSERRFFRHRDRIKWDPNEKQKCPKYAGVIYPKRIKLKHYQYRSPKQIEKRLDVRKKASKDGYKFFKRDLVEDWKCKLQYRKDMIFETAEYHREAIYDPNIIPWYWQQFKIIMHYLKIYP
jgi:glycosyltransferase involved in cell wall biosynthesis